MIPSYLLAFAASALALNVPRWDKDETTTMTTYETVTTCPVTETKTEQGTTYEVTQMTTSTVTVTTCYGHGCGGATVTIPGPTSVVGTTTEVDVTYTTVCPVTETITAPGETYTTVYTTTSVVYTKIQTTIYETVESPPVTKTKGAVQYSTITSLCPVTETKTVGGSTIHVTWTSTQLITTIVPTTIDVTVGSDVTVTEYPTVVVTQNGTVVHTHSQHPTTVVIPTTAVTIPTPTQASTSAPVQISNAANPNTAPAAALFAGIFGAIALL